MGHLAIAVYAEIGGDVGKPRCQRGHIVLGLVFFPNLAPGNLEGQDGAAVRTRERCIVHKAPLLRQVVIAVDNVLDVDVRRQRAGMEVHSRVVADHQPRVSQRVYEALGDRRFLIELCHLTEKSEAVFSCRLLFVRVGDVDNIERYGPTKGRRPKHVV
jgi:hypothetical protein